MNQKFCNILVTSSCCWGRESDKPHWIVRCWACSISFVICQDYLLGKLIDRMKENGFTLKWDKTEFMCFHQDGAISSLNSKPQKLVCFGFSFFFFRGYQHSCAKVILVEVQFNLFNLVRDFLRFISPKLNVIALQEFKLVNYDVAIQNVWNYVTRTFHSEINRLVHTSQ